MNLRPVVAALVLLVSPCLAGATYATATHPVRSGGSTTYALDEDLFGFNVNTTASDEFVLQEIMNLVWPSVFTTTPAYRQRLDTRFVTSARSTTTGEKQTVVYRLNPAATWSDGVPITADDFIYNWQAQSGNPRFRDKHHRRYDAAITTGYDLIKSVKGSSPAAGGCSAGSAAHRTAGLCPNGDTVTMRFRTRYADWQALFGDLVPAHEARKYGWNTGFDDWHHVLSGGWYRITGYARNHTVVLSRNPKYWGTPGKLNKIVFRILGSDSVEPPALANGNVNFLAPEDVTTSFVHQVAKIPGVTTRVVPGLEYEHFDFNETNRYLAKVDVRRAIADGTNRRQLIARTVGKIDRHLKPANDRLLVNGQPFYAANGKAYDTVHRAAARHLLRKAKMRIGSDGYFHPTWGPLRGRDLTLRLTTTSGDPMRSEIQRLFRSQMKQIGIKITIVRQDVNRYFGSSLPRGRYDIGEFAWVDTPFISSNESLFCSYTDRHQCGENWVHFRDHTVDELMAKGAQAATLKGEAKDFNAADRVLWRRMVTLPLFQYPEYFAWDTKLRNVEPNGSAVGATWNAENWGYE
jgi:peptide/nickel transport system substrate-binding protein